MQAWGILSYITGPPSYEHLFFKKYWEMEIKQLPNNGWHFVHDNVFYMFVANWYRLKGYQNIHPRVQNLLVEIRIWPKVELHGLGIETY
jgi:hypothetical protein